MTHSPNLSQSVTAGGTRAEHYPSLELCKKLTEAGFHNTNLAWFTNTHCNKKSWIMDCGEMDKFKRYVCPSVMELLDRIKPIYDSLPRVEQLRIDEIIRISALGLNEIELPNALAEMWLWLKENNYLIK